jgi:hypothetical protein
VAHSPGACSKLGPIRPRYEVAQITRACASGLTDRLSAEQKAVLRAITTCRTAELGGHLQICHDCGHQQPQYNSCRNRHCPKCQALAQFRWLEARRERILPVHHFHVVFTVPAELRSLVLRNRRLLYALLFDAAPQTLLALGLDGKRLGGQLGVTAVLHTWARDLGFHPHLHCVVTGGGLSTAGDDWVKTDPGFLFPVRVLGALFRGKFLDGLRVLYNQRRLDLSGSCGSLQRRASFEEFLDALYRKRWQVYCKPPFGNTEAVFAYLGRYTHRVGISNARIAHVDDEQVRFDTRDGKQATVTPQEFLRRFLLHVLPKGFVRIRHFGLLAPGNVHVKLDTARRLLTSSPNSSPAQSTRTRQPVESNDDGPLYVALYRQLTGIELRRCCHCGSRATSIHSLPSTPRGPP